MLRLTVQLEMETTCFVDRLTRLAMLCSHTLKKLDLLGIQVVISTKYLVHGTLAAFSSKPIT